jgi:uncharacterized protein
MTKKKSPPAIVISDRALALARRRPVQVRTEPFRIASHPPQATPKIGAMAMDQFGGAAWAQNNWNGAVAYEQGQAFIGFPELAVLSQRAEYRRAAEVLGTEMTRGKDGKWISFQATGKINKADRIKELEAALDALKVQDRFRDAAIQDSLFGRSHLYLDTGSTADGKELEQSIGNGGDSLSRGKVSKKNPLLRLQNVEAVWCYPLNYNTTDPLAADWYKPAEWFALARRIHRTRLLTFIGRPVSDLLKPAYSFGGLSLTQMLKPTVDNWLRTRQGVSDIITSFTVFVLLTNLVEKMAGGADSEEQLMRRAEFFNLMRDNKGLIVLDKALEDFKNVSAPLGTLDQLQAQSQEHMASISGIPLVKLTGIAPSGLNASSDGEIRSFYDWILALQESLFRQHLKTVIDFTMLSLWNEIDFDIGFKFEPLWQLDAAAVAAIEKTKADIDDVYYEIGAVSGEEIRRRLADDEDSIYDALSLDPDNMPDPPDIDIAKDPSDPATTKIDKAAEGSAASVTSGV